MTKAAKRRHLMQDPRAGRQRLWWSTDSGMRATYLYKGNELVGSVYHVEGQRCGWVWASMPLVKPAEFRWGFDSPDYTRSIRVYSTEKAAKTALLEFTDSGWDPDRVLEVLATDHSGRVPIDV